jgi:hypothetical protein
MKKVGRQEIIPDKFEIPENQQAREDYEIDIYPGMFVANICALIS